MTDTKILSGDIWNGRSFSEGYVILEDGILKDVRYGESCSDATPVGCIMPKVIDTHTHIGDAGLKLNRKYDIEELVAPPDGLKHRYLRETDENALIESMTEYAGRLTGSGVSRFIDFRENGLSGTSMLKRSSDRAVILGRPTSPEFDINEIESILDTADGIGISSITDVDRGYIDRIADAVKHRNKILALHVSERIREDIDYVLSLEPDFIVHMVQATDSDLRKCADSDIPVSVCASSNLYFGMVPPIKRMIDSGISVSVGTDNAMLFPSADIMSELRIFNKILVSQGGNYEDSFISLIAHGKKILYEKSALEEQTGKKAEIVTADCSKEQLLSDRT